MPLKYVKNCNVCKLVKHDKQLAKRILNSNAFSPDGKSGLESIKNIHEDYSGALHYNSLLNHAKNHYRLNDRELAAIKARYEISTKAELENNLITPNVDAPLPAPVRLGNEDDVFNTVIEQGLEKLKSGEMQLTATHLINAANSKANLSLKRKDQELKIQEMIWHFASGEGDKSEAYDRRIIEGEAATAYDPAAITARNADAGED